MSSSRATVHHDADKPLAAPTPSEKIVKAAAQIAVVEDANGHTLKIKRLDGLDMFDLSDMLGAERAANLGVGGPASAVYSIIEIDGEVVAPPRNFAEIRALVKRMDRSGLSAITEVMVREFGEGQPVGEGQA